MSPKKSMPPSLWNARNSSPSCPVAERTARKIRRNEFSLHLLYIYRYRIYVRQRQRCLGVHVLGRVGGIGSPPKYPRPSYPIHLLLFNRQITFHWTQRMAVCNHRDRSSRTFIVTPRGIFLHEILDRSLTFSFHPHRPNLMPPAQCLTSPPKSPPSPHLHTAVSCVG